MGIYPVRDQELVRSFGRDKQTDCTIDFKRNNLIKKNLNFNPTISA